MKCSQVWHSTKIAIGTFTTSVLFFYSHLSLIIVSLIPSTIRSYQMWSKETPFWLEGIVGMTRVFLFILIVSLLSKVNLSELKNRRFWEKVANSSSAQLQKNWPSGVIAQIIVFIVLLYGLGNAIIIQISELFVLTLKLVGSELQDPTAAYRASIYFLKNMSVIPLAIVYILNICGVKPINKQ